jgi:catechol 2,3-dioxygenase-like lactoylglutathione lyase family enzyme
MPRGIDHLVLAVHDLDAAGAFYERLGFRVGARNRHPWGTENRLVQFPGSFLELIGLGEAARIPPHLPRSFSFGAFVRDWIARNGEGFAMLVLESEDAEADARSFEAQSLGAFDKNAFTRLGRTPEGRTVTVAFSLAFAEDRLAPECGFFVCQQHYPENFWNPAFQRHPNGALGLSGVVMVAENPSAHAEFLTHFIGEHDLVSNSAGIAFETPRGSIEVLTSAAFHYRTGVRLADEPARLRACRFGIAQLGAMADRLRAASIPFSLHNGAVIVAPEDAFGTTLLFEAASLA